MDVKDFLPSLLKLSPALLGAGILLWLIAKMTFKYFTEENKKREDFFVRELEKREDFFKHELEKKDKIIHEKDEDIKLLNEKLVAITQKFIEVTEKNSQVNTGLKEIIAASLRL